MSREGALDDHPIDREASARTEGLRRDEMRSGRCIGDAQAEGARLGIAGIATELGCSRTK